MGQWSEVFTAAVSADRKFVPTDVTDDLRKDAEAYARTWSGTFEFMVDMQNRVLEGRGLTDGQVKGVLNVMRAAYLREQTPAGSKPWERDIPGEVTPVKGAYVVQGQTWAVRIVPSRKYRDSWTVKYAPRLTDGRSGDFAWAGFVKGGTYTRAKGQANDVTDAVASVLRVLFSEAPDSDNVTAMRREFAARVDRCSRCSYDLTDEESRARGLGPECVKYLKGEQPEWDTVKTPAPAPVRRWGTSDGEGWSPVSRTTHVDPEVQEVHAEARKEFGLNVDEALVKLLREQPQETPPAAPKREPKRLVPPDNAPRRKRR